MLKFLIFVKIYVFGEKCVFAISESEIRKKSKLLLKYFYGLESSMHNFRAIYPQITWLSLITFFFTIVHT